MRTLKKLIHVCFFALYICSGGALYASVGANVEVQQSERVVRGTVVADDGEPLIGVSIRVSGASTVGAITNAQGEYSIKVPPGAVRLEFSYVGMKARTVSIDGRTTINVTLSEDAVGLNELVAIGYGTARRKDITGSVSSITSEALAAVPVSSAAEAITGKMAGVQITTTEGSPDAEVRIRVRGGGSITQSNDPLFIVDGFPVASISDIPPADIESIDVLKDASSTAIYGSRGANGVVIVTTKSGKTGKISVSYNGFVSFKKIAKTLNVLKPYDYVKWQYELTALQKAPEDYQKFFGNYQDMDLYRDVPYNDWQDITFGRTGRTFNHSLSITGGTEKMRYAFNYSHVTDKAIMYKSGHNRNNLSFKLTNEVTDKLKLDFNARYSKTNTSGGGSIDPQSVYDSDRRLKYSVIYTPIPLSNLNATSGSSDDDLGNLYHPIQSIHDNDRQQSRQIFNLGGAITYKPLKNLTLKSEIGMDNNSYTDQRFWGLTTYYIKNIPAPEHQGKPVIRFTERLRDALRTTNTISYDFKSVMPKNHGLNLLVGHEYMITQGKNLTSEVHNMPETFTAQESWRLSSEGTPYDVNNYIVPDDKLLSYFTRANYDYDGKYLLSATFRADASSRFNKMNRWGYFPSVAGAWRISSEPFMEPTRKWLDDLKLRLSYGTAGNNNIPSGQLAQTFEPRPTAWINGFDAYWAPSKVMANPYLKWETTVTRNFGIDFTLLKSRLSGSVELYLNSTKDLLIDFPVPGTGYDTQYRNMGENQNRGVEATINWMAVNKKNFTLNLSANIGFNKSEIISLGIMDDFGFPTNWASTDIGNDFMVAKGGSVGQLIGYRSDGRYEVSDFESVDANGNWKLKNGVADASAVVGTIRPGTMKLKNLVGDDNKVTVADREIIGNVDPVHTGGFSINSTIYNFDIAANFNWSYGHDVYNANKIEYTQTGKWQYRNMLDIMAEGKRWTNLRADGTISNDPAELAAMNATTTMWSPYTARMIFSDWAVEDGSFLRLNTLVLGYTLPKRWINKMKIENLRLYVTGYNIFVLTKYSGFDPEVSTMRRTNLTPGVDYSSYPKSRQITFGLNLNF